MTSLSDVMMAPRRQSHARGCGLRVDDHWRPVAAFASSWQPAGRDADMTRLGVISDTHGRVDPALREIFAGVERIVHAGDVGTADVLVELATIAPVTAVRGNVDVYFGAEQLPDEAALEVAGRRLLVGARARRAAAPPRAGARGLRHRRDRPLAPLRRVLGRRRAVSQPGSGGSAALWPAAQRGHRGARATPRVTKVELT